MSAINLFKTETITDENVRALISSADDSRHKKIAADKQGNVHVVLHKDFPSLNEEGWISCCETLAAGNGYLGARAGADKEWVADVRLGLLAVAFRSFNKQEVAACYLKKCGPKERAIDAANDLAFCLNRLDRSAQLDVIRQLFANLA